MALNGERAWRVDVAGVTEVVGKELRELQEDAYILWLQTLVPLREKEFTLAPLPDVKVEGQPCRGVKVRRKGSPEVRLSFDKGTNFLVKVEYRGATSGLPADKEVLLGDHRVFDGVRVATKEVRRTDGKKMVDLTVRALRTLASVDEATFTRP
jgi:hypothetical protein